MQVLLIGTERSLSIMKDRSDISEMRDTIKEWTVHSHTFRVDRETKRIAEYSQDLTRRFSDSLARHGALTERLDRSFVRRLLRREYPEKTAQQLLDLFKELDDKRRELTRLGLLTVQEDVLGEGAGDEAVRIWCPRAPKSFRCTFTTCN